MQIAHRLVPVEYGKKAELLRQLLPPLPDAQPSVSSARSGPASAVLTTPPPTPRSPDVSLLLEAINALPSGPLKAVATERVNTSQAEELRSFGHRRIRKGGFPTKTLAKFAGEEDRRRLRLAEQERASLGREDRKEPDKGARDGRESNVVDLFEARRARQRRTKEEP